MCPTFQRSFGPPFGHSASRPVSWETPFRCGPRHCGQSPATTNEAVDNRRKLRIPKEHFITGGFVLTGDPRSEPRRNIRKDMDERIPGGGKAAGAGGLCRPNRSVFI